MFLLPVEPRWDSRNMTVFFSSLPAHLLFFVLEISKSINSLHPELYGFHNFGVAEFPHHADPSRHWMPGDPGVRSWHSYAKQEVNKLSFSPLFSFLLSIRCMATQIKGLSSWHYASLTHTITFILVNFFLLALVQPAREFFLSQSQGPSPGLKFHLACRETLPQVGLPGISNAFHGRGMGPIVKQPFRGASFSPAPL